MIGSALEELENPPEDMTVQGRDLLTGKPKETVISYREIAKALDKSIIQLKTLLGKPYQNPPRTAATSTILVFILLGGGSMLLG
ncbi:MAG: hypothetical protein CM15mP83_4090 [Flavobacteriaceae bacterium]|nr:MAG: hypothetical protein CM15mP83_4090 [Flavobacteriaceae bacterium]